MVGILIFSVAVHPALSLSSQAEKPVKLGRNVTIQALWNPPVVIDCG
jgi:hypothetical protein